MLEEDLLIIDDIEKAIAKYKREGITPDECIIKIYKLVKETETIRKLPV